MINIYMIMDIYVYNTYAWMCISMYVFMYVFSNNNEEVMNKNYENQSDG